MLRTFHIANGKISRLAGESHLKAGFNWVDCIAPTKDEIKELIEKYGASASEIEDALDKNERSRIYSHDSHHFIIFKRAIIGEKEFRSGSIGLIWSKNNVITVHKKEIKGFENTLRDNHEIINTPSAFIHLLLEFLINSYFDAMEKVGEQLERLEEAVLKVESKRHTEKILKLRKTLIYYQKNLLANRDVLGLIKEGDAFLLKKDEVNKFRSLYNDAMQLIDLAGIYSEILSTITETDISSTSNALGDVMKKLTVIASFALVPTLIASIYGMNFRPISPWNMPELDWFFGYPFSLGLMAFSVALMYVYFKKQNWL